MLSQKSRSRSTNTTPVNCSTECITRITEIRSSTKLPSNLKESYIGHNNWIS